MTSRTQISRSLLLPDQEKVARCARAPELGPHILFFSGGTALRFACRSLKNYTHNSVHLITPFDSGGSSAEFRRAFQMLSIGDLRNRIIALADESALGNPEIYALFSYRFDRNLSQNELRGELEAMVGGDAPLIRDIPAPLQREVRSHLRFFKEQMPHDFDLRGASLGNLILAGGYLQSDRDIASVIDRFSKLVAARGTVMPVVEGNLHLAATLADSTRVVGQHHMTGKEFPPISSAIESIDIIESLESDRSVDIDIQPRIRELIESAELIVFPVGSFYSSVLCNLLPRGVGAAIAATQCPKIYIPSMGTDPETRDTPIAELVARLISQLRSDAGDVPVEKLLNRVLVDTQGGHYTGALDKSSIEDQGVEVADVDLAATPHEVDPEKLTHLLLSLAG